MTIKHTVLIAEDHALFRAGLRLLLSSEADLEVIAEAENGSEAIRLALSRAPTLVLMDLSMPVCSGLDAIIEIKRRLPSVKILVVTMHKTDEFIQAAFRNGASGYILKESSHAELRSAIRTVLSGKLYVSPDVAERMVSGFLTPSLKSTQTVMASETLTARERQILKLVAEGNANKNIADHLHISAKTVEKHRSSLMSKLKVRNTAGLTAYAISKGILAP